MGVEFRWVPASGALQTTTRPDPGISAVQTGLNLLYISLALLSPVPHSTFQWLIAIMICFNTGLYYTSYPDKMPADKMRPGQNTIITSIK